MIRTLGMILLLCVAGRDHGSSRYPKPQISRMKMIGVHPRRSAAYFFFDETISKTLPYYLRLSNLHKLVRNFEFS